MCVKRDSDIPEVRQQDAQAKAAKGLSTGVQFPLGHVCGSCVFMFKYLRYTV